MKVYFKDAVILIVLLSQIQLKAQSFNKANYGVYESAGDFTNNRLTYSFNNLNRQNRLVLYSMFGSSKIEIIINGEKKWFKKKDIYGYRDNGTDYRIFNNDAYAIVDTTDFFLYNQSKQVTGTKWQRQKQTSYYFSVTPTSGIEALSKSNIENAFAYNTQFDHYLNTTFKTNEELIVYDKRIKKYKLKYLYEEFEKK